MIIDESKDQSAGNDTLFSNSEEEPAPPPYEASYESYESSHELVSPPSAVHKATDSITSIISLHTRKRRFIRFLLVAVVLVLAFGLLRSYLKGPRGRGSHGHHSHHPKGSERRRGHDH
ncbi:hypothetical protein C8F04DRAFT_1235125 [Mycena alexandri]|uniref:Uncharacterized protein n=1 Tax=Mycena alexandri TaxID=1745969 RepID=A0AAD6SRW1_9AGAR|nr:hypothetical protein C8F04DRAFT_1235125 [Mycena alexandri]